ncbi:uncharacterized protein I206_105969 [Kwoniella pini CBS 10737]|uniref:UDENN domain-containing protein n=1 Tax=Kwoniella pini CBS 10737 TaxID=1296096 RepID=A0A1B9I0R6_9TREE|nr:uncharacterized protein I206_04792 [Kwoniella pini CBS 10737]OCF49105.1 hypothetical protein I206_04792 [Kwoniella pini CBS 10737]
MSGMPLNDEDSGDISLSSSHFHIPAQSSSRPSSSGSMTSANSQTSEDHTLAPKSYSRERDVSVPAPAPQRLFGKSLFSRSPQPSTQPEAGPSVSVASSTIDSNVGIVSLNDEPISEAGPSNKPPSTRRQSSGLGRSRSLNVKLPSLDTGINRSVSPMSATSRNLTTPTNKLGWSRRPGEPRPPPLVSENVSKRMSRWVKEVVVCNFDLERGPVVERRAGDRRWGPGEKENVAFSSFPDTSLFAEGSILFSFKIRHIPPDPSSLHHPEPPSPMPDRVVKTVEEEMTDLKVGDPPREAGNLPGGSGNGIDTPGLSESSGSGFGPIKAGDKAEEYRRWDERGREWLYGFVWFEQRRDKGITRGYMQKSLVILTHLPFPTLFSAVLQKVAPTFFEFGYSALEAACHSIASWPDPTPDSILELPMLTDLINVKLPDTTESPQIGRAFGNLSPSSQQPILAALPTSTPLRAFASFLPSLWSLWECLILAEPVLIIAPDPKTCSEIVWWLRDLLRPIPPAGDFRPYLHIHDHDFSLLVNSNKPQAGVIVGVTNPFFRNAASHWPNVISIPSQRTRRIVQNGTSPAVANSSPSMKDQPEGFLSRRHRGIQKDRVLLKRLEGLVAEGKFDDPEGNEALRTYFQQLTERFLVPLNRYFQTLVPTISATPGGTSISPIPSPSGSSSSIASTSHTTGVIRPFSLPNFLNHLRNNGPNPLLFKTKGLSLKSRVENDFYASFCMSSTFARWLELRVNSLGLVLNNQSNNNNINNINNQQNDNLTIPSIGKNGLTTNSKKTINNNTDDNRKSRPGLPRSISASVGLGILGDGILNENKQSPILLNYKSEEEEEEEIENNESSEFENYSNRDSLESGESRNNWNLIQQRPQRDREGSDQTIVQIKKFDNTIFDNGFNKESYNLKSGNWFDTGRRVSEGNVQYKGPVNK